jgi:hypothetical protein
MSLVNLYLICVMSSHHKQGRFCNKFGHTICREGVYDNHMVWKFHAMLSGSTVTTAWHILGLRIEETASRYGG